MVTKRRRCYKVEDHGEMVFPLPQVLIIVNEKPSVGALDGNFERIRSNCKFFRDSAQGSKIIVKLLSDQQDSSHKSNERCFSSQMSVCGILPISTLIRITFPDQR